MYSDFETADLHIPKTPALEDLAPDTLKAFQYFGQIDHSDLLSDAQEGERVGVRAFSVQDGQPAEHDVLAPVGIIIRDEREGTAMPLSYVNLFGERQRLDPAEPYPFVVKNWLKYVHGNYQEQKLAFTDPLNRGPEAYELAASAAGTASATEALHAPTTQHETKARQLFRKLGNFFVQPMLTEEAPRHAHANTAPDFTMPATTSIDPSIAPARHRAEWDLRSHLRQAVQTVGRFLVRPTLTEEATDYAKQETSTNTHGNIFVEYKMAPAAPANAKPTRQAQATKAEASHPMPQETPLATAAYGERVEPDEKVEQLAAATHQAALDSIGMALGKPMITLHELINYDMAKIGQAVQAASTRILGNVPHSSDATQIFEEYNLLQDFCRTYNLPIA